MTDKKFIDGLIVKPKHERAPDYVLCKLSIKREALIAWLQQQHGEWINADIKQAQTGKLYAQVDDWKPDGQRQAAPQRNSAPSSRPSGSGRALQREAPPMDDFADDDIPF